MQHIFWLTAEVLAGRSGPTRDAWNLKMLQQSGIGAILSVNDGGLCHGPDIERIGMEYQCTPLSPNAPPEAGDLEHCVTALPKALAFVQANERKGRSTLVHCHSGKDRTGLFMAYYLVRTRAFTPSDAIFKVREIRPIAFTAPGWEEFAYSVLVRGVA